MSGTEPDDAPTLPQRERRRGPIITTIVVAAAVVVAVIATLVLVNRPSGSDAAAGGSSEPARTVTIGIADISQPYWKTFATLAKQQLNVSVKYVNFTDYSQPNPALKQKQLDLNEFQHLQYLANYNVTNGDDLQPIGATAIYPLPLYSTKYDDASALPAKAKVAIPNDAVNEARGLLVLQSAGLLTLKDGGTAFSTTKDIETAKVDVQPIDASQTATALKNGSVAAAIVNKNYAVDAGLPKDQVIAKDDPASAGAEPYVNAFVARKADAKDPVLLKLAALYHDASITDEVQKENGGDAVFQTWSPEKLQGILATVEADAKSAQQ
ncbi:MetQ/NlpA family ABC transporter substrate-binding protein [uncultured Amnibacterium sp.]|uniref:MetQ/NlpA family ABC transporter substrate-binding protein n=1 Tax=uncultured Amnibacterium sp. TaxID=1631851 RepID=UPI0035CA5598